MSALFATPCLWFDFEQGSWRVCRRVYEGRPFGPTSGTAFVVLDSVAAALPDRVHNTDRQCLPQNLATPDRSVQVGDDKHDTRKIESKVPGRVRRPCVNQTQNIRLATVIAKQELDPSRPGCLLPNGRLECLTLVRLDDSSNTKTLSHI